MSPHHAFEPPPLFRDGQMPTAPELILDLLQLRPQPLRDGDTSQPETSLLPLRADVREAEEVECLGLAEAPSRAILGGVTPELDQPGRLSRSSWNLRWRSPA